ncbi:MAG: hypothetical protein HQK49_21960, partial [Oligoflexia bacterium]|nr:hypothetical protein [Oligoflexia bacterium]
MIKYKYKYKYNYKFLYPLLLLTLLFIFVSCGQSDRHVKVSATFDSSIAFDNKNKIEVRATEKAGVTQTIPTTVSEFDC